MGVVLTFLAVAAGYGLVAFALVKLAARAKRRGIASPIVSVFDEIWHPAAHEPQHEIRVQHERIAPTLRPDDPLE